MQRNLALFYIASNNAIYHSRIVVNPGAHYPEWNIKCMSLLFLLAITKPSLEISK